MTLMNDRPLFIPVILGTVRKGRASENVAKFVFERVKQREGVETELIDIGELKFPGDDAGEQIKDKGFSGTCERADGLVLVVPEYNHGYPGMLKHVLDSNLKEYIHKAVGICGVSAGGFGGTRVIQSLLPVLRELGLVTIFWDGNFSGASTLFDETSNIKNRETHEKRIDKFLGELIWMSRVLRYGRESVSI
jgi:NAD(P)H-dependent FMN reductase